MYNYPKISIVTPNYNGAIYLEKTIRSILDQGYPNLEYIIIDGGSTDNSVDIIKKYEKQINFWISEKDNGLYDALQKGFDKSTGEIMAYLNSDDIYHSNALFTVAEIFSSFEQVQWLQGKPTVVDEKGRCVLVSNFKPWSKYDYYLPTFNGLIQQESTFWRRNLWEKAGGYINNAYKYAGDYELWLRFFRHAGLYQTHAILGAYRARSSNQLSVEHSDDYELEAKTILNNWQLTKHERRILKRYKRLQKFMNAIPNIQIINKKWLLSRFRNKYFEYTPLVHFKRCTQAFQL